MPPLVFSVPVAGAEDGFRECDDDLLVELRHSARNGGTLTIRGSRDVGLGSSTSISMALPSLMGQ